MRLDVKHCKVYDCSEISIEKYIGKPGYFSNDHEFSEFQENTLQSISEFVFCDFLGNKYRYFIAKDNAKFITGSFRPFRNFPEFQNALHLNDPDFRFLKFREKRIYRTLSLF